MDTRTPISAPNGVASGASCPSLRLLRGSRLHCTVAAEYNILIGRLAANLSGVRRVDLCICDERRVQQLPLPDIPTHSAASSLICQESITFHGAACQQMIARLVAVDEARGERLLGEYTFNHTRSLPAPDGWPRP